MIYIQLIFLIFYANSVALEGAAFAVFAVLRIPASDLIDRILPS